MKTKEKKNCWFFKNEICMKIYTHASGLLIYAYIIT